MAYNCLIIDEDYKKGQQLKMKLGSLPIIKEVHNTVHPYQINNVLMNYDIDVVFIRLKLWDHRLFAGVYALKKKPSIVLLTSITEKYKQGDTRDAELREPYEAKHVLEVLREGVAFRMETPNWEFFFVRFERRYHKVFFSDIELVERIGNGTFLMLHTTKKNYLLHESVASILKRLPAERFSRISDTLIIPVEHKGLVIDGTYTYKGNIIQLTYRYMKGKEQKDLILAEDEQ